MSDDASVAAGGTRDLPDAAIAADQELLADVAAWVSRGEVVVENGSGAYFSAIERVFPIGVDRVDWTRVRGALSHDVMPRGLPEYPYAYRLEMLAHAKPVLVDWFAANSIRDCDDVVAVGDNSHLALHMRIATLLECYPALFCTFQHYYVVPAGVEWCLTYTLEETLYFGWAANATRTGEFDAAER
jgi:hypothetical protein